MVPKNTAQDAGEPTARGTVAAQATPSEQPSPATGGPTPPATCGVPTPPPAANATPAAAPLQIGELVIGSAKKHKDAYDNVQCRVVQLLATHVKVTLLEGEKKGTLHKYLYPCVARPATTTDSSSSSAAATGAAATGAEVTTEVTEAVANSGEELPLPDAQAQGEVQLNVADIFGDAV